MATLLKNLTTTDSIDGLKVVSNVWDSSINTATITLEGNLTSIDLGDIVDEEVVTLTLPSSVTSIAEKAFSECTNLTKIILNSTPIVSGNPFKDGGYTYENKIITYVKSDSGDESGEETLVKRLALNTANLTSYSAEAKIYYEDIPSDYTNPVLIGWDDPDNCINNITIEDTLLKIQTKANTSDLCKDFTIYLADSGEFSIFEKALLSNNRHITETQYIHNNLEITGIYEYSYTGTEEFSGDIIAKNTYSTSLKINSTEATLPYVINSSTADLNFIFDVTHPDGSYLLNLTVYNTRDLGNYVVLYNTSTDSFSESTITNSVVTSTIVDDYYQLTVPEKASDYWYIGAPAHITISLILDEVNTYSLGTLLTVFIGNVEFNVYKINSASNFVENRTLYIK